MPRWKVQFMTMFDERDKHFEKKFAHDEELEFKANARRNKLLGIWAAQKMGLTNGEADKYAKSVVLADFDRPGHEDVVERVLEDLQKAGIDMSAEEVRAQMERLMPIARAQVTKEVK